MPTYGKSKERDMVRSILPSTRRREAKRALSTIRRAARSYARRRMAVYRGLVRADAEALDHDPALDDYPDSEITDAVWTRRAYDKIGPLWRWAPHRVATLPIEDRLTALRSILPDTTVGRHAISHLERNVRVLAGIHDVDAFVGHWCSQPPVWRNVRRLVRALDAIGV